MKYLKIIFIILIAVFSSLYAQNQNYSFKGRVIDSKTKSGLPGITIRIENTTRGTISDDNGNFLLILKQGLQTLKFSSIGYESEDITIDVTANIEKIIELKESFVQLSEVLVVAEDPGIGIIRRAIANKKKWMEKLKSYQFTGYTKQTLFKEDSVASITESYSNGFWKKDNGFREKVFQRRQTENIKLDQNFAMVGGIVNFNDDELKLSGYTFTGPTAPSALDDYTFKLLKTYDSRGYKIYELQMIPLSRFKPLFEGIICIADSIYAISKVEVKPNDVFKIPFVKDFSIKYIQRFNVFDTIFWMPTDISVDGRLGIKIPGIKFPAIGIKQRSILYDYSINRSIPDSIFGKTRFVVDSNVKVFDSIYWNQNKVLPLTANEEKIYKTLDSTKTLDKQFRPEGPLMALENSNFSFFAPLEYVNYHYNRTEGHFLGAKLDNFSLFSKNSKTSLSLGYGFSDKKWKGEINITQGFPDFAKSKIGLTIFNATKRTPEEGFYPNAINTFMAIFSKVDYGNYYDVKGFNVNIGLKPLNWFSLNINYLNEKENSVKNNVGHGFMLSREFRVNPPINEGRMGSLSLGINLYRSLINSEPQFIRVNIGEEKPMISINIEKGDKSFGSDFNFTKYNLEMDYQFPTFLRSLFLPPYFALIIKGSFSTGLLPQQRIHHLESAADYLASNGVFKTMSVKEFAGDSYFETHLEHNFRSLPFRLLNLSFIEDEGIEFIIFGSSGKTWLKETTKKYLVSPIDITQGWFTEGGFGFSKIFLFIRTDFSWRFTERKGKSFFISIQLSNLL